jgi:hypothetical protein
VTAIATQTVAWRQPRIASAYTTTPGSTTTVYRRSTSAKAIVTSAPVEEPATAPIITVAAAPVRTRATSAT